MNIMMEITTFSTEEAILWKQHFTLYCSAQQAYLQMLYNEFHQSSWNNQQDAYNDIKASSLSWQLCEMEQLFESRIISHAFTIPPVLPRPTKQCSFENATRWWFAFWHDYHTLVVDISFCKTDENLTFKTLWNFFKRYFVSNEIEREHRQWQWFTYNSMSVGNVDGCDWFDKSANHQVHKAEEDDYH